MAEGWSTACLDWERRIVAGESLVPPPLFPDEAKAAMAQFRRLKIVDAAGSPSFGDVAMPWIEDFAASIFGAYDAESGRRLIREFFLLIAKKNGKSTVAAAIMVVLLMRNWRKSAELLILSPTIEIAANSFGPAKDMIRADDELSDLLHIQDHTRTITHRVTGATLKVVAADSDIVGGKKASFILLDEMWLLGKKPKADAMLREATGGLVARPEGAIIYLSTQSDESPTGVFASKLDYFRAVRDGRIIDPKSLPCLYEYPQAMIAAEAYFDPSTYRVVNPNLGRSVDAEWLAEELTKVRHSTGGELQTFLAKHANLQIGLRLAADRWAGADYWEGAADPEIADLEVLIQRSEVAVVGIDGGGLDDLLGLAVIGREKVTKRWLVWSHAWAHTDVLVRRQDIATRIREFETEGTVTVCDWPSQDLEEVGDIVERLKDAKLLPEEGAVGLDPQGVAALVDELMTRGVSDKQLAGIPQGFRLTGAILGTERKLKDGSLVHGGTALMSWCVGNCKVERKGSAVVITKQAAGSAKIDPVIAVFDAVALMSKNPAAKYEPQFQAMFLGGMR